MLLEPYKANESSLREALQKKNEEINQLLINMPNEMNEKIKKFVKKAGNISS